MTDSLSLYNLEFLQLNSIQLMHILVFSSPLIAFTYHYLLRQAGFKTTLRTGLFRRNHSFRSQKYSASSSSSIEEKAHTQHKNYKIYMVADKIVNLSEFKYIYDHIF